MKFTLEKVCKMTGLPATTLRNWEKRYGFPRPVRSSSGHRTYLSKDLEFLRKVKDWIAAGRTLSEISGFYQTEVLASTESSPNKKPLKEYWEFETDVEFRVNLLLDSLLEYDMYSAVTHFTLLNAKLSTEDVVSQVFEPLLLRASEARASEEITAAQLHFIQGFVRLRLMNFLSLNMPPSQEERIVFALVSEYGDELGSLMISVHMKFRGYSVSILGPHLPLPDIELALKSLNPDCVAFFYTEAERLKQDLPRLAQIEIPVCLMQYALSARVDLRQAFEKNPAGINVSEHDHSPDVADFLEMVSQCTKDEKSSSKGS